MPSHHSKLFASHK